MIKVVVDRDIPFLNGVLDCYAKVEYCKGTEINNSIIKDSNALIIRTRTICDKELLEGTSIESIYTATIGTDHIDKDYCEKHGIAIYDSSGCNAWGVVQYVINSIFSIYTNQGVDIKGKSIGIIGCGNVGERLAYIAKFLGFNVIRHDPQIQELLRSGVEVDSPLGYKRDKDDYFSLDYLLKESDIVSLHVPLNNSTYKMCNDTFFTKIKKNALFINSSRGAVIEDLSIIKYRELLSGVIMDVWNNEPAINPQLLSIVDIATPHIAGYSLEGKANATQICVRNFSRHYKILDLQEFKISLPSVFESDIIEDKALSTMSYANNIVSSYFDILKIDKLFREDFTKFERIRDNFDYRRETPMSVYLKLSKLFNTII